MRRVSTIAFVLVPSLAGAQDSSELVRAASAERERRARLEKPAPVYSNVVGSALAAMLSVATSRVITPEAVVGPAEPPAGAEAGAAATNPAAGGAEAGAAEPERDESWWRERMADAERRAASLAQDLEFTRQRIYREQAGHGQPRSNAVYDPQTAIAKLLAEASRLEAELAAARAEPKRIREEARRAGVPPGWLR